MSISVVKKPPVSTGADGAGLGDWLFAESPDCVKILDLAGNLVAMNENGLCVMEIDDFAGICGYSWASLWSPEVHPALHIALGEARNGNTGHFYAFAKTAKGTPKWWDVMVTAVRGQDGQISALLAVSRDVTQVHEAQARLEASEARYRSLVTAVSAIVWTTSPSGQFETEQPEWTAFTGQTFEQIVGSGWLNAVHPDDRAKTVDAARLAHDTRKPFHLTEQRLRRADGQYRFMSVQVVPVFNSDASIREWAGVHTDITERKKIEKVLSTKEHRLRLATDVAGLGIWTWAPATGTVMWENDRIFEIFGLATDAKPISAARFAAECLHPDDVATFEHAVAKTLGTRERFAFQGRVYQGATGQPRWLEFFGDLISDEGDQPQILGTVADITERKKSEDMMQQAADDLSQADRRKTEFIMTLAHELRNPLSAIRNGLQVMQLSPDNPATVSRVRGVIERQVGQMVHLIDDLLDVARISRGHIDLKKEVVDLKDIAAGAIETSLSLIEAGHHDLTVMLAPEPLPLFADPGRIAQVLSNLLNNAAKYTPQNGTIHFTAVREDAEIVITVSDSGIGIPAEALANVFDMFAQVVEHKDRAQGGLGIGLSLVRRLVDLHQGTVQAFSPGRGLGSSFVVRLPAAIV